MTERSLRRPLQHATIYGHVEVSPGRWVVRREGGEKEGRHKRGLEVYVSVDDLFFRREGETCNRWTVTRASIP